LNTPKFQGKIRHTKTDHTFVISLIAHLLLFMPSTSLEMYRNRFRPGLRPGPYWGSLQRSLRPLAGGEGARRVLPKNPTPSSALLASAIQAMLCRPPTPPKINPSYGLVVAGVVVCLEQGADLHTAQLMPLLHTVSCFRKIQIGFTFLVPAYVGSPGKRAAKRACVCVAIKV